MTPTSTSSMSTTSSTHAYAIMSTSSALLSRSNSTNSSLNRHSFSPAQNYQGHRHSKSLSYIQSPHALPTPPSTVRSRKSTSKSDSESDTSYSDLSEGVSEPVDSTLELDPIHQDLRDSLLIVKPDAWSPAQLACHLRFRYKKRLADLVIANGIAGIDFINCCNSPSDVAFLLSDLAADDYDDLLSESRNLRMRLHSTGTKRIRKVMSKKSGEDDVDDTCTSESISRRHVKSMVAALENATSIPNISKFSSHSTPISGPQSLLGSGSITVKSWVEKTISAQSSDSIAGPITLSESAPSPADLASEEPNIQALIENTGVDSTCVFGARAWEQDAITVTAKRLNPTTISGISGDSSEFPQRLSSLFIQEPNSIIASEDRGGLAAGGHPDSLSHLPCTTDEVQSLTVCDPPQNNTFSTESELIQILKNRVAELEEIVTTLETSQVQDMPSSSVSRDDECDLPQYLLMASVGVFAIVGQAVLKKLFWSHN